MKKIKFSKIFVQEYIKEVKNILDDLEIPKIERVVSMIIKAYKSQSNIFIFGNGGSSATATHMVCDLTAEKRLRVISLTDNAALLTAVSNDLSFDEVFVQQLKSLMQKRDLVIAISASGNSTNVIKGVKYAKENGAKTIGLLGFKNGGNLAHIVDIAIIVQSNRYGPVEDVHLVLSHIISLCIKRVKEKSMSK